MFELFVEIFGKWNNRRKAIIARRTTRNELSRLSNHDLKDIGLSRCDISWVAQSAYLEEMNRLSTVALLQSPSAPRVLENDNLRGWSC
tara:strand:- start:79 stop:342 length:264 start_codon:yes stop_codon:yes gene_type:complete